MTDMQKDLIVAIAPWALGVLFLLFAVLLFWPYKPTKAQMAEYRAYLKRCQRS